MNKMRSVICFLALVLSARTPRLRQIMTTLKRCFPVQRVGCSAQTNFGILYAEGSGVTRDYKKRGSWFEQAGKQNYADAEYNPAMYGNGDGGA